VAGDSPADAPKQHKGMQQASRLPLTAAKTQKAQKAPAVATKASIKPDSKTAARDASDAPGSKTAGPPEPKNKAKLAGGKKRHTALAVDMPLTLPAGTWWQAQRTVGCLCEGACPTSMQARLNRLRCAYMQP
jgi:hypothetical protein